MWKAMSCSGEASGNCSPLSFRVKEVMSGIFGRMLSGLQMQRWLLSTKYMSANQLAREVPPKPDGRGVARGVHGVCVCCVCGKAGGGGTLISACVVLERIRGVGLACTSISSTGLHATDNHAAHSFFAAVRVVAFGGAFSLLFARG